MTSEKLHLTAWDFAGSITKRYHVRADGASRRYH